MNFIDLKAQYEHLKVRIDQRIAKVLEHGQYIMGPEVQELEERLSDYVGAKHCISCANGTDALQLALMALGVKHDDAVIVPSFTFFASAEAVAAVGAEPVFVDIEPDTYNLSPSSLIAAIEAYRKQGRKNLKAVMSVDLFGQCANYPEIEKICAEFDLLLIEDAAQGFGGSINGNKACSFGDIATTSFFPAKPLGCYGDGGAVFTDNDEYAELLRSFRVHGKGTDKYDNIRIGMNSRLDTIQAAILLEKLAVFPQELNARQEAATWYQSNIHGNYKLPALAEGRQSSWAQYTLRVTGQVERDVCLAALKDRGIPSAVYYPVPVHSSGAFLGADVYTDLHQSEKASVSVFSVPMHPYLSEADQEKIAGALNSL
ncbi:MAG: aminotransferase class I/II-fold pyridoxal phosphate-dependent enzyme [Alteromonadaceae bacterium]|nr:aminotransferase class I/II-fold pyridoxal phosphate-dependent enzyme [Alteromonadaceae bacterium]